MLSIATVAATAALGAVVGTVSEVNNGVVETMPNSTTAPMTTTTTADSPKDGVGVGVGVDVGVDVDEEEEEVPVSDEGEVEDDYSCKVGGELKALLPTEEVMHQPDRATKKKMTTTTTTTKYEEEDYDNKDENKNADGTKEKSATGCGNDDEENITKITNKKENKEKVEKDRKENLVDALGGPIALRTVVDEFYARVVNDPTLRPFFDNVNVRMIKWHSFNVVRGAAAFDYPTQAFGKVVNDNDDDDVDLRKMLESKHASLLERGLNASHFDLFLWHLKETLVDALTAASSSLSSSSPSSSYRRNGAGGNDDDDNDTDQGINARVDNDDARDDNIYDIVDDAMQRVVRFRSIFEKGETKTKPKNMYDAEAEAKTRAEMEAEHATSAFGTTSTRSEPAAMAHLSRWMAATKTLTTPIENEKWWLLLGVVGAAVGMVGGIYLSRSNLGRGRN